MIRSSLLCSGVVFRTTRSITCCAPALDLLEEALARFDEHFQNIVAEILRVPCLSEDQWDQASLPVKFSGLGVNQTKVIAGSAYIGSCTLTRALVAALLGRDVSSFEPGCLNCSRLTRLPLALLTLCRLSQARNQFNRSCPRNGTKLCLST